MEIPQESEDGEGGRAGGDDGVEEARPAREEAGSTFRGDKSRNIG